MTKKDQFEDNEEIPQRTLDFLASLGITKESFLWVENYCPDTDPNMEYRRTVYPKIDVPVLEFINQVCAILPFDRKLRNVCGDDQEKKPRSLCMHPVERVLTSVSQCKMYFNIK